MERRCKHTFFLYLFTITLIIVCSSTQRGTAMPVQDTAIQNTTFSDSESGLLRPDAETLKNPFWPQVEELLNSYVTEDFDAYVTVTVWDHWNDIDREQEHPAKYIFPASVWKNNVEIDDSDVLDHYLLIANHNYERKEYFDFYIWVEEIDGTDVLKTDFSQQLFAHVLAECTYSIRKEGSSSYLIGNAPSFSKYAIPYYELLEEPLVLQASSDVSQITSIFENAYDMMYEWQSHITGDLSQNIRFCDIFSPENEEVYITPEKPEEELTSMELTNWSDTMSIQGYHNWLDKYGQSFPEHLISFDEDYSTVQEELFAALLEERQVYRTTPVAVPETDMDIDSETETEVVPDTGVATIETETDTNADMDISSGDDVNTTETEIDTDISFEDNVEAEGNVDAIEPETETVSGLDTEISSEDEITSKDDVNAAETEADTDMDTDTSSENDADTTEMEADTVSDSDNETISESNTETTSESDAESVITYVVNKGDTLWDIAERYYGDGQYAYKIWDDNRDIIGNNFNFILPGMQLKITDLSIL